MSNIQNNKSVGCVSSSCILKLFQQYKSRRFIFVEPGGNPGDDLIYRGAEKLACLAGISYCSVCKEDFMRSKYPRDSVVYIHGGGGYIPLWDLTPKIVERAITVHAGPVIIGPTTFSEDMDYIGENLTAHLKRSECSELTVFAREHTSFNVLEKAIGGKASIGLDHDTALNLSAADLVTDMPRRRYLLYSIRTDGESMGLRRENFFGVYVDPACHLLRLSLKQWVYLHSRATRIHTDRLHSAIVGTILGIPVTLIPNNYHKNRSVCEYSLRSHGVKWANGSSMSRIGSIATSIPGLDRVENVRLFNKIWKYYYGLGYKALNSPKIDQIVLV